MLYDVSRGRLISIDYGCILNTATFDYPLCQLTTTDTILWSDLFKHLVENRERTMIELLQAELKANYIACLKRSERQIPRIIEEMPKEWNVSADTVEEKLRQLFDERWTIGVWKNFVEQINENIDNG